MAIFQQESGKMVPMYLKALSLEYVASALLTLGCVSALGAIVEKWRILGEVNPYWPKDLPALWRGWNVAQLLEQHRSIYPNKNRVAWFRFFRASSIAVFATFLLLTFLTSVNAL
jgi:hypothetical protein